MHLQILQWRRASGDIRFSSSSAAFAFAFAFLTCPLSRFLDGIVLGLDEQIRGELLCRYTTIPSRLFTTQQRIPRAVRAPRLAAGHHHHSRAPSPRPRGGWI